MTEAEVVLAEVVGPGDQGARLVVGRKSMRKPDSLFERSGHERVTESMERAVTEGEPGASGLPGVV